MPFLLAPPHLGNPEENPLYFDPGDGRLLTVFTNEKREDASRPAPREIGCIDHIAFNVSRATFHEAAARLTAAASWPVCPAWRAAGGGGCGASAGSEHARAMAAAAARNVKRWRVIG
mgnify:CR=1 FL=1